MRVSAISRPFRVMMSTVVWEKIPVSEMHWRAAKDLYNRGEAMGALLSQYSDLLVIGECVPGGTTTALCVLRALGYSASVSSSFVDNPVINQGRNLFNSPFKNFSPTGLQIPLILSDIREIP